MHRRAASQSVCDVGTTVTGDLVQIVDVEIEADQPRPMSSVSAGAPAARATPNSDARSERLNVLRFGRVAQRNQLPAGLRKKRQDRAVRGSIR
jgi:hypothetical protein